MQTTITPLTKAQALKNIEKRLTHFRVPAFRVIDAEKFRVRPAEITDEIAEVFGDVLLAVRSSAADEDGLNNARAGEYGSVLNVPADDLSALKTAIETVIVSYDKKGLRQGGDEVIVQEMVLNTSMSGVVFTHDLNTGAPYYVINYDDVSGLTNTVTSGDGKYANRTLYIHRGATKALRSERFHRLIEAIQELEQLTGSQFLDVEFALGEDCTPYLFQVRAITTQPNWNRAVAKRVDAALQGIQVFVRNKFSPVPGVYGNTTVLGQMPDWNPAEMIGRAPRALAFSLYKTLITDNAWRMAREQMGYAVPPRHALMLALAGQPFIDTRLSFHSYLPASLTPQIGEKLVNIWIQRLREHPELHDKIEFDIAITTYSFDIEEKIKQQTNGVLSRDEEVLFKESLREQTNTLLLDCNRDGISQALYKLERLGQKQIEWSKQPKEQDLVSLFEMIDNCIYFGTIPFAMLARHGFVARTLLLSLHRRGILDADDVHRIQAGTRTIAGELVDDMRRLKLGELSHAEFMERYGHLRPGTYDILSLRYDQLTDLGLNNGPIREPHLNPEFELSVSQRNDINRLLNKERFGELDAGGLLKYIKAATIGREYGKFVFTRTVSDILELVADFGRQNGLSREEMSHIPLSRLLEIANNSIEGSVEDRLRQIAETEAERHALSAAIRLPQVLYDEAGVHVVPFQVSHPNFISNKKVTAACIHLHSELISPNLAGLIVLIENADPGFDWIFGQPIAGLITKYGGANSHMAIRCAEFGIPAAIGCGEQRFEALIKVEQIMLDCSASVIQTIY